MISHISHSALQNLSQAVPSEFNTSEEEEKRKKKKSSVCVCVFKYQLSSTVFKVIQTVQGVTNTTELEIADIYIMKLYSYCRVLSNLNELTSVRLFAQLRVHKGNVTVSQSNMCHV